MHILMTAFGPFRELKRNPSEMVLEHARRHGHFDDCMVEWVVLPVTFRAVENFVGGILPGSYDVIIHTGVAVGSLRLQIELHACNRVKGRDVDGVALEGVIEEKGPAVLTSPLASHVRAGCQARGIALDASEDAGGYLCNYIYYKSLRRLGPHSGIAFLHLADFVSNPAASSLEAQAGLLVKLTEIMRDWVRG